MKVASMLLTMALVSIAAATVQAKPVVMTFDQFSNLCDQPIRAAAEKIARQDFRKTVADFKAEPLPPGYFTLPRAELWVSTPNLKAVALFSNESNPFEYPFDQLRNDNFEKSKGKVTLVSHLHAIFPDRKATHGGSIGFEILVTTNVVMRVISNQWNVERYGDLKYSVVPSNRDLAKACVSTIENKQNIYSQDYSFLDKSTNGSDIAKAQAIINQKK